MLIGDKPSEQRGVTQDGSAEVVSVTIDAASDRDGKVTASPDHGRIAVQDRHDHGDGVLAVDPAVRDNRRHHAGGQSQSARTVTAIARARACRRHAKRLGALSVRDSADGEQRIGNPLCACNLLP